MKHIGLVIKQLCKEKNISITTVAEKLNKTRQTVYQDFARDNFTSQTLEKYAEILGMTLPELLAQCQDNVSTDTYRTNNSAIREEWQATKEKVQEELEFYKKELEFVKNLLLTEQKAHAETRLMLGKN
ncbi:Helix-turn-helix [Flexibacter flexilis DSM 6793]|uniref:Helix-turn-helix n=1 Tax=Flexibacter flexilis DSM 6793 TaxID=927664 RepID=A0A1I1MV69_9BACT|nr:helix-turn-helix transcriptional regulator [Flexibacter flexilis]SFC87108.1 Helix-turn-helix [Flexibacter flexilis DSM 6793]